MQAIFYDHGRYHVTSESTDDTYLVDVLEPKCDCPDFRIRVEHEKSKPECKHFPVAFEQFGRDMAQQIKTQLKKGTR